MMIVFDQETYFFSRLNSFVHTQDLSEQNYIYAILFGLMCYHGMSSLVLCDCWSLDFSCDTISLICSIVYLVLIVGKRVMRMRHIKNFYVATTSQARARDPSKWRFDIFLTRRRLSVSLYLDLHFKKRLMTNEGLYSRVIMML